MRIRHTFLCCIALVTVLVAATALVACDDADSASSDDTSSETAVDDDRDGTDIEFSTTFGAPDMLAPACDDDGNCVLPLTRAHGTIEGSITGRTVSGGVGTAIASGGYSAAGVQVFVGTIEGCGTGTLVWTEYITSDGVDTTGTWTIVEGSGTGDLESVTGGGTFDADVQADSTGSATGSGTISCA